jgi:outer membrane beta-barrel protein
MAPIDTTQRQASHNSGLPRGLEPVRGCAPKWLAHCGASKAERFQAGGHAPDLAGRPGAQQFPPPPDGDPMPFRMFALQLLAAALPLCATGARAQDVIYGPDGAPTVVQRKLYRMTGRWEAGASFGVALNNALVDQVGGLLSLSYHPNEWLDVGGEALLNRTALSGLARNVRADLRPRSAGQVGDEFRNDNQLREGAFAVARVAPFYGKLNLASELRVHFQAFLLGGAGAAQVHRESVNLCAEAGTGACESFQQSDALAAIGILGGGFRFYFNQRFSLRTEVRSYLFRSSYKRGSDLTQPSSGSPAHYLASIFTFGAGLSVLF